MKNIFENTSVETTLILEIGDILVQNDTVAEEKYKMSKAALEKKYEIDRSKTLPSSLKNVEQYFKKQPNYRKFESEFKFIPYKPKATDEKRILIVDKKIMSLIKDKFPESETVSQNDFKEFINSLDTTFKLAIKDKHIFTIEVTSNNIDAIKEKFYDKEINKLLTIVSKSEKPVEFYFMASWGSSMALAEDDILVVTDSEVYRIAKQEFYETHTITNENFRFSNKLVKESFKILSKKNKYTI